MQGRGLPDRASSRASNWATAPGLRSSSREAARAVPGDALGGPDVAPPPAGPRSRGNTALGPRRPHVAPASLGIWGRLLERGSQRRLENGLTLQARHGPQVPNSIPSPRPHCRRNQLPGSKSGLWKPFGVERSSRSQPIRARRGAGQWLRSNHHECLSQSESQILVSPALQELRSKGKGRDVSGTGAGMTGKLTSSEDTLLIRHQEGVADAEAAPMAGQGACPRC